MGHAGRQFRALLWKNWLCRVRHPVLSLAEFLWPCILFLILTVLRFQEPPRHRDTCYLQARDLPSRGVFPFVQSLLCNTGSQCQNISYEGPAEHPFWSSRFQTAADHNMKKINHLAFLRETQDVAKEMYETMEKATHLQKLWEKRSKTPDSSGSSFLTGDLNKIEDMISKLESLHKQPPVWNFLLSLPQLYAKNVHLDESIHAVIQFLQVVLNSLISLEDLVWLPLNHTFSKVSESILNMTISTLSILQDHVVAVTEQGYNLTLKDIVWDPQLLQYDLKFRFGLDDLHSERILNYSTKLKEISMNKPLERTMCLVLSSTSEDDTGREHLPGECHPRWSEARDYLVQAISWPRVYTQVFGQWHKGNLLGKILVGILPNLKILKDQFETESKPRKMVEALYSWLLLLNDTLAVDWSKGSHKSTNTIFHTLEKAQLSLEQTADWDAFIVFIRKTCEVAYHVNMQERFYRNRFFFSEESPCYEENMDWKIITDNYFLFLHNLLKSPTASISRVLNSTKDLLMMENKLHHLEDEQILVFLDLWEQLLLPTILNSSSVPKIHNFSSHKETFLNTSLLWINYFKSLEKDPPAMDTENLLNLDKVLIKKIQTFENHWMKKTSENMTTYMEQMHFEVNPKRLELLVDDIFEGQRAKLKTLSTLLNFSVPDSDRNFSKNFNFTQLFHSDWSNPEGVNLNFVHLSETILGSLYEFGFMRQEQVSEALNTIYLIRNASDIFSMLSEHQKQEVDKILTQVYQNIIKGKNSASLLQMYALFYQHMHKFFLSIQDREPLLTFLTQISKHILDILKNFNFQNISKAFSFFSEITSFLGRISEKSYCQQMLSIFQFLELQAQLLKSTKGQDLEMIHATLSSLKQLFIVDKDFRISLFDYLSQLFNSSREAKLGIECFSLNNKDFYPLNNSTDGISSFGLPWAQILLNLSARHSTFNEFMAIHCTISWFKLWTEIWESISQIFKLDAIVFTSLHVGLNQVLDELENDAKISKACQGIFSTNHPAVLLLNFLKTVTQAGGFHHRNDFLHLHELWGALGDALVIVKSLHPDKIEKSLFTMEATLQQLKTFPLNTNLSKEFLYSLLEVFIELSNTSDYIDRNIYLPRYPFSNNLTNYGVKFESVITELRETISFLRNVSQDRKLLSCADVYQNVTKFIFEDDLSYANSSQRAFHILAMLNSTFSSENITHRLKGCIAWVAVINNLYDLYNSSVPPGHLQSLLGNFRDMEPKIGMAVKLITWALNIKKPLCSRNASVVNCIDIYLKNVTQFLNVMLTKVFEKEPVPKFDILLTIFNDSTNQIRMIINNLTQDLYFASQSNWNHVADLLLRPTETSNKLPDRFQNMWLHLIELGKEIQKLVKDISSNMVENVLSSPNEKLLNVFTTSPKEKVLSSLGNSIYQFASYLAFSLPHDLQNFSKIIPREVMQNVGLGIQLFRDVFNVLMPAAQHGITQNTVNIQVLKKVSSLMYTLKKADIDLLVDQLDQMTENLMDFFKNITQADTDNLRINLLVGLMEKFLESAHSWNVNHLLKLSRLFPKHDVNAVVDAYYVLPHAVRLLQRVVDKNITKALKDVYNFTLLHGITISNISKEDFASAIKSLSDTVELVIDKPGIISEIITCFPEIWCWNHATSELHQKPKSGACHGHRMFFSSFYGKISGVLKHLQLSQLDEDVQCSNTSSRRNLTSKVVCIIHGLMDWNSVLLEMSDVFHIRTSLLETVQEFLHTLLPYVLSSGFQSNDSISQLCTGGSLKRGALQIIKILKTVNITKVLSGENLFDSLASLKKILNINEGADVAVPNNNSLNLERIGKSISDIPSTKKENADAPYMFKQLSSFKNFLKRIFVLLESWQKELLLTDESVVEMCQVFKQTVQPPKVIMTHQKVKMLVLHVFINFADCLFTNYLSLLFPVAENPSLIKDILCATLSCGESGIRPLMLSVMQGFTLLHSQCQEIKQRWPSPSQLNCASLSRQLFRALENFKNSLEDTTEEPCECQPALGTVQQHTYELAKSLEETWSSGNPFMTFFGNFTITDGVKVKDLMENITRLTEELQSSTHLSNETINCLLEANISHSKVLSNILTVALAGRCDRDTLHLLLTFREGETSLLAVKELCALSGPEVYSLIVLMSQHLNLRNFFYKTLIPPEANNVLNSLLDVVSSLSSLLVKAQHVLAHLPEFLQELKISTLLDMSSFQEVSSQDQYRSSAFGSFQSVMKMVCKEKESFLSSSNTFIDLPRVNDLLDDDKEKFNIPEDSTPFCIKLYQEILQFPNGALVWAFLKPILHGKILYTPNTPEINEVIQKANYTFYFVDKIKTLSETLLNVSSLFQSGGNSQMVNQFQEALRNKFIRTFIESQLHIDVDKLTEKLQSYGGMLGKMRNHTGARNLQFLGQILVNLSSCVVLNRFQAQESAELLETTAHELMQQNNFLASIVFTNSFISKNSPPEPLKLPPHVTYTIRTSILYSMRTDMVKNPFWKFHPQTLPAGGFKYNYIFVPLQDMIERAIIAVQTGQDALEPATRAQAIPYPCHTSDLFLNNVGFFFPLIMMLTWVVSVASMVRKLAYEREIQIEEYMRMMGVHPTTHFLAWFLENMATLALGSVALAIVLKTSGIFVHSNAFIIFLFLLDFGVSLVMLSYFLSAFFSQANTAALCTSLVYMISFLPYIVLLVLHNQLSFAIQTFLCFLSTTAFGQGVFFITFLEGQEAGIQWNNMYQSLEQESMTFGWVCWMILFDSSLYFLCGWYFSNLIPGTFGLRKPWYFPFTASYWKNICGLVEKKCYKNSSNLFFINENFASKGSSLPHTERNPGEGRPGVTMVSVTKEYELNKVAIRDLTLTFHRDQITALLGTNGAGKTTIISMLTGLHPPTSGTIIINGKNLQTDLSAVRMELGVCPQHNVLFDNLTVLEHLLLFASIKAPQWTKKELHQQVNKTLQAVELTQHRYKQTRTLSGGMKRKLSIGMAFIGMSQTVILDEPTSGVDPCSRRSIWDILFRYREGRTVIFTTHHLDEAEVLSDCIAILQQGRLRCCGPAMCLKEAYGQGLQLTLTKQPSVLELQDPKSLVRVTSLIQSYVPQAFLKSSSGSELTYALPKDTDKASFTELFQDLDQNLHHLQLTGYGISDTTLEESYLQNYSVLTRVEKEKHKELRIPGLRDELELDTKVRHHIKAVLGSPLPVALLTCKLKLQSALGEPPRKVVLARGTQLLGSQMAALLRKRLLHTLRAWRGTLSDLLLPVLFVALAMGLFMVRPLAIKYPPLKLAPGHYERAEAYFYSSKNNDPVLAHMLLRKFGYQDLLCATLNPDLKNSSCWHTDPFPHPESQNLCGCRRCPNGSSGAPYLKNDLGHTLLNLSAFDVEEYLLVASEKPRLGGWSFGEQVSEQAEDANSNLSKPEPLAKVWYNQKGFHSLPSYLNHLNNLILWQHLPPSVDWRKYGITLYSHPYGGALLNEDKILESIRQCGVALCIVLGFSILTASIGSAVVKDRVIGAKRLQHISGLGYRTYWFTNFLYDLLFYLVSVGLCLAIIMAFQLSAFTFRENLAATALLLALFGYATLPWMYLMSRIFSSANVAFISYISLNFICGLCTMLMTIMPRLLVIISKSKNLQNIYDVLKWVFTIFPQFCLGRGLIELCYNQIKYDLTHNFGIDSYVSPFEMNFLGWIFVELTFQGTALLLLRLLLHWDLLQRPRSRSALSSAMQAPMDVDVEKEQRRVFAGRTGGDVLVLYNLSKSYQSFFKKTPAVQNISLGIPRGECFGLLGVNGAGKTTTFKMLTGDVTPTSGHAFIRTPMGDEVALSLAGRAGVLIGYCPQQDALDELLTGWEHLHYYCSLRGIPKQHIPEVAGDLVRRLHLEAHADQLVGTYSGGTKRKLSTALALVGKPEILLLDEPSSGMDPCSKRYLWDTIMKEVQEGCAAVLTSHSMEECEALCTRLALMIHGSFMCLGSPQHIKNRFGEGYSVKVWLCKRTDQHHPTTDCLKLHFPEIQFKGQRLNLLEYRVPKRRGCLADLFNILENNKSFLNIKHYSINQTTLEEVFITFATEQHKTAQSALEPFVERYQPLPL
ncbi:ATP-binding cassette sub-family A member 13 [Tenrec ecaudatus]|uniref:ATP-binding cassette sub-family A member 13 n=1 Tax=Tenrec ecaudatus TaxID=94439 RepID=UPI003F5AA705